MTLRDALLLGRVSNLPTVWSNLIAATAIAGVGLAPIHLTLLVAMSLMYVGGMYLNDAFDAKIDAAERPERPIPAGRVSARMVFAAGFGMLGLAVIMVIPFGPMATLFAGLLAVAVVAYNIHHKGFQLSPVVMGLTRLLVYLTVAAAVLRDWPGTTAWIAGAMLLAWIIGLTYVAKQENLGKVEHAWPLIFLAAPVIYGGVGALSAPLAWAFVITLAGWAGYCLYLLMRRGPGDVPRAVVRLIAGVALLDAVVAAAAGAPILALACVGLFGLTLYFQRIVPGT